MSHVILLVGIIFIYVIFMVMRRSKFSFTSVKNQDDSKKPEDQLTILYQETAGQAFLKSDPLFFLDDEIENEPNAEKYSYRIAKSILTFLNVSFSTIKVIYSARNEPPRVAMNDYQGYDFYIPIDLKKSKGAIRSLIAYECCRIFMAHQKIEFANHVKSRHLNDYATIFIGLGVVFLKDLEDLVDLLRHVEPEFSYFTDLNDLFFVMAAYLHQRGLTVDALDDQLRPYYLRMISRSWHDLKKMPYIVVHKDAFDANIRCQKCFQILRVPAGKKLLVTCSTCNEQFEVKT